MTLDSAQQKAAQLFSLVGRKTKKFKNDKIEVISRVTAFKKTVEDWDVAIFFVHKQKANINKPDCFLADFTEKYEIV
ncbi:MAG TPA: hypothetical protein VNX01_16205 [Bacteroidia bacterium]|jgi:hypothetical protein|nr:hypothetical protein [Bacteroidia bacterium]